MQLEGILKILRIEAHVQTVILAENFENLTEVSPISDVNKNPLELFSHIQIRYQTFYYTKF